MSYASLVKTHPASLGFGFLHAFFSGFGQTFLIALFAPYLIHEFDLSNTSWGVFYSGATLGSAVVFPWIGSRIDSMPLVRFSLASTALLALSAALLGAATSIIVLLPAIVGLRLGGQALMNHIAATAIARSFTTTRGRALSLSSLGHPVGEALMPLVAVVALSALGWRATSFAMAGLCLAVLGPLSLFLLKRADSLHTYRPEPRSRRAHDSPDRWRQLLRFPLVLVWPAAIVPPFVLTGFFLHQETLVQLKHWPGGTIAAFFVAFAAARTATTFLSGRLVDRYTARRLFPFYLAPLGLGLLSLTVMQDRLAALFFLLGAGLTVGAGTTIKSALWAELFPAQQLGSIRSIFSLLTVVSTAISPALFGWCLDQQGGHQLLLWSCVIGLAGAALLSSRMVANEEDAGESDTLPEQQPTVS